MPQIGQFTRTPSGFSGQLRTLSLDLELTFVPADNADALAGIDRETQVVENH